MPPAKSAPCLGVLCKDLQGPSQSGAHRVPTFQDGSGGCRPWVWGQKELKGPPLEEAGPIPKGEHSIKTILALLSAAGLCAHGGACAQSTTPAAPKAATPALSAGKLPAVPAKPGSGQTAALINAGGNSCPRKPDGSEECTVEVTGPSDGGGGQVIPNLPSDNFGNPSVGTGVPGVTVSTLWTSCAGTVAGRFQADLGTVAAEAQATDFARYGSSIRPGDTLHMRWSSGEIGEFLVLGIRGTRTISRVEFQGLVDSSAPSPCRGKV